MVPKQNRSKLDGDVSGGSAFSAIALGPFLGGESKSEGRVFFSSHCSRGNGGGGVC
jgi:hypothetical protein